MRTTRNASLIAATTVAFGLIAGFLVLGLVIIFSRQAETAAPQPEPPAEEQPPSPITIAAVGDVLMGGYIGTPSERIAERRPLRYVAGILRKADVAVCNLECPLSERGQKIPLKTDRDIWAGREYLFRGTPQGARIMAYAGFDVASLANNHIMDFGPLALDDTITALSKAGIAHSGSGINIVEARTPTIVEARGSRIAFLSYAWAETLPGTEGFEATADSPGCVFLSAPDGTMTPESVDILVTDIRAAREMADLVIVCWHGGIEKSTRPLWVHRHAARTAIAHGADAVIAHHPHVLQGIEMFRGKPIAHSLGNFVFPSRRFQNNDTCILLLRLTTDGIAVEAVPVRIYGGVPRPAYGSGGLRIGRQIARLSSALGTECTLHPDGRVTAREGINPWESNLQHWLSSLGHF